MNKFFIFLFFLFLITGEVIAAGFSPSSLTYKLNVGEKKCQMITINSNSEQIMLSDKWAENKDVEWKVSKFNETANYNSLSISYPKKLDSNQKNAEICLSGKEQGEYHGVILLTEQQKGNLVAQMGIWVKAVIGNGISSDKKETSLILQETIIGNKSLIEKSEENTELITEISKNKITAEAVSEGKKIYDNKIFWIIGILMSFFMLLSIRLYIKRRKEF